MPNYRSKNRNRNKNKQRNKQQQQQQQKPKTENYRKETEESPPSATASNSTSTKTTDHETQASPHHSSVCKEVAGASAISAEINVCTSDKSHELGESQNVQSLRKVPDVTTATTTATAAKATTEANDTVLTEPPKCDSNSENKHGVNVNNEMGNEKSKINANQREAFASSQSVQEQQDIGQATVNKSIIPPNTSVLGKVIVHRIVCEDANNVQLKKAPQTSNETNLESIERGEKCQQQPQPTIRAHKKDYTQQEDEIQQTQQEAKVIVHQVITTDEEIKKPSNSIQRAEETAARDLLNHRQQVKALIHKHGAALDKCSEREEQEEPIAESSEGAVETQVHHQTPVVEMQRLMPLEEAATIPLPQQQQAKVIVHQIFLEDKEDEEQPTITSPTLREPVLGNATSSASQVRIVEVSDESLSDLEELRSPVVSEAESSIEYSDENQKISESITEVSSTSSSASSAAGSQRQSRKQKRMALEHHFLPQMLNPRFLDSISEENSELSDNSENPLSRSASTDSATNCPLEGKHQKLNAKYPMSSFDFSKSHKSPTMKNRKSKVVREETKAVAVAACLQDAPDADESCTLLRSCMSPEAEAAEVVFINSASSSITDLHDMELFENNQLSTSEINLNTDTINNTKTENICFDSPTQTRQTPLTSAFAEKIPEFYPNQCININYNNNNNNQITIDNSKIINNNTAPPPHTPTATTNPTTETDTKLNTNSQTDSICSSSSSPANNQLVFAQIEEQISSVLSSIDEVAKQHTTTTNTTNTTIQTISSSPSSSTSSSSSSSSPPSSSTKFLINLSNTQTSPVTTTSTTAAASNRSLETSSEESFNSKSNSSFCADNNAKATKVFSKDVTMNTVRDIINENTAKSNGNKEQSANNGYWKLNYNNSNSFTPIPPPRGSPPPPPIPPPSLEHLQTLTGHDQCDNHLSSSYANSTSSHALPLLEKNLEYHNSHSQSQPQPQSQSQSQHDFTQSLKNALSQLTSSAPRQESLDSHCSDSTNFSQCTAINLADNKSDQTDTVKASLISDLKTNTTQQNRLHDDNQSVLVADPKKLRLICAETLASFPYGDVVLEELASVAQNIGESRAFKAIKLEETMPYPLPDLPHIDDLQLSLKVGNVAPDRPPQPPQQVDQSWLGVPTSNDPKLLVCLSPSQRSYIQQKPEQKPDDLLDAHQKFVERRGYHEYTKEQLHNLEKEKLAEQQLLQTAAIMKKLRKSITPPPPQIPPPPVPIKSSETASKAQNLSKRTNTATTSNTQVPSCDVSAARNESEQTPAELVGENNGEENKHRLLTIMQETNEPNEQNYSITSSSSLSYENNSRRTANGVSDPAKEQVPSTLSNVISNKSKQLFSSADRKATANMQSVETTLGKMFPTMGSANIFDQEHKRFSNIESSNAEPFCTQILTSQPKRYSSIETHCYEAKKLIENGKVIEDFSTTKHESKSSGDKPDDLIDFPLKSSLDQESNSFSFNQEQPVKLTNYQNDQEIMSALNLNKHSSDIERKQQKQETTSANEKTTQSPTKEISHRIVIEEENKSAKLDENDFAKQTVPQYEMAKSSMQDTYEEFRQRAKAAADGASTLPALNSPSAASTTAKVTSNGDRNMETFSSSSMTTEVNKTTKTTSSHGHETLFKEFDDLSKQLHKELEHSKVVREQREKSASMFDLNRVHMRQKQQIEEFNKSRYEHLKELEQEIQRSIRSRSAKPTRAHEPASVDVVDHQTARTHEIPIQIENGHPAKQEEAPPIPKHPKTYQIPIHIEYDSSSANEDQRFRRAESMFNLNDEVRPRQRTFSNQTHYQRAEDDWSKYASDLGSSENIARPFAKEVEICYQRRPGGIRAPRLTVSTNDLSNHHTYDQYNAHNVRKHHHAPMLNAAPKQSRPKYGSCYSMIERDPNPKYISTTTRRGVSPAPQSTGYFPLEGCHVREEDMRQRRASLPRELHEQQLKYITSKEEELRTEFERLQSERRRLMEETQRAQAMQLNQAPTPSSPSSRPMRESYRQTQKLPTLTEDEVFRQQMAEEWLNKVAERENRRLQNIIKISKIHEDEMSSKHRSDMGEEFLSRVKERRHKLAMPADSDWESGAESQPTKQAQLSEAEDGPPVKILEGEQEANLRHLPRHLKEFAKFSNHQKENIAGGHREQHQEEERSEETTDNTVSKAFKKSSVVKTVKTLRAPMLTQPHGHDDKFQYHKPTTATRPRDSQLTDRVQRRSNKQTRFAVTTNRRSWSESDLLQEIDKDLKLAKGFLFQDGIWSPKNQTPTSSLTNLSEFNKSTPPTPPPPPQQPIWTPQASPQSDRKQFRPVHFESPTLPRKYVLSTSTEPALPPWSSSSKQSEISSRLPQSCTNLSTPSSVVSDATSAQSYVGSLNSLAAVAPKSGISEKIKTFERSASASDLYSRPQVRRIADRIRPFCKPNEVLYNVKHEYMSEPETENERPKKMAQLGRRQYDGIGPTTNDGMPIILRSEVKEPHQHEWYKRLYQTIHKQKHGGRNQYNKPNGYQSEPEPNYDSDYSTIKYRTVNPNRLQSVSSALNVRKSNDTLYGTLPNPVKSSQNSYKNQPGRIEDYVTGHSSVSEKEKKEQLDQAKLSSHYTEGNLSRALAKESGYASDSNLVFRKKELPQSSPLSPVEQKQAYKSVQAGGEPPLFGFRKPAPEKAKDYDFTTPQLPPPPKGEFRDKRAVSPNRYYESDVNIHFKTPVRQEFKYPLSEEELAIRQAEQMQKLYQEERRRKYLQELQDMNSRRHTDNFTPSQKSPIPLNRYDDFPADLAPKTTNQIKSVARALYNFQAQNSKELSFKKGDIIYIKRAIDKNWYEGEHNAMIGLFPANYVEIINKEPVYPVQPQPNVYRKPSEGQARAKYNFQAQSGVELSLNKGELVALTRRVDDNWFEGRIANRKGIFPVSYVEVLTDIGAEDIAARTTTIQQVSVVNARPSLDALRTNINNEFNTLTRNGNQPPNAILRETRNSYKTDILHVDTSSEPLVYRALYKYRPQNSDELELQESDIVHVLEKCDDGWYVGTSQRTGCFGTFPGNYVERV